MKTPIVQFGISRFLPALADLGRVERRRLSIRNLGQGWLDHRLWDIAQSQAEKRERRIAAFRTWARDRGVTGQPRRQKALMTRGHHV